MRITSYDRHDVTFLNKSVYCVMLNKPVCVVSLSLMCSLVLPVLPMLVLTAA